MDEFLFLNELGSITDTNVFRQSTAILDLPYSIDTPTSITNEDLLLTTTQTTTFEINLLNSDNTASLPYTNTRNSLNVMSNTMDYLVNLLDKKNDKHTSICKLEEVAKESNTCEYRYNRTDSVMSTNTENILVNISDTMDNLSSILGTVSNLVNDRTDDPDNLVALDDIKNDLDTLTCTMNDLMKISEKKMKKCPAARLDLENLENVSNNSEDDYYLISPSRLDLITIPDSDEELHLLGDAEDESDAGNDLIKLSEANDDLIIFENCESNLVDNISDINLINL